MRIRIVGKLLTERMKMVFYSLLLVASVITALIFLYFFRHVSGLGTSFNRALTPSAKNNSRQQVDPISVRTTNNDTPTPWGWKGSDHEIREHGPHRKVHKTSVNSAAGLDAFLGKHENAAESDTDIGAHVGWPYRDEGFEPAGRTYKVKRKAGLARTNLKTTGKPWGW